MRLTPHAPHDPIRIKREIAHGINSFFFRLEIFGDRRPVRPGQRRVADKIEIRFRAAGDHSEADRESVAAFCLDIAQNCFAFEAVEAFSHGKDHSMFGKVIGEPRAGFRVQIAVQQKRIAMHQTNLVFHQSQTRCRLACK